MSQNTIVMVISARAEQLTRLHLLFRNPENQLL